MSMQSINFYLYNTESDQKLFAQSEKERSKWVPEQRAF